MFRTEGRQPRAPRQNSRAAGTHCNSDRREPGLPETRALASEDPSQRRVSVIVWSPVPTPQRRRLNVDQLLRASARLRSEFSDGVNADAPPLLINPLTEGLAT